MAEEQAMRKALEEAFDAEVDRESESLEEVDDPQGEEPQEDTPEKRDASNAEGEQLDLLGDAEEAPEDVAEEADKEAPAMAEQGSEAEEPEVADQPAAQDDVKPPAHWKPDAREHWAKLPPEVQREATRLEKKMDETLAQSAGYRKMAQEYYETVAPYQHLIQAQGTTPAKAVSNLLSTAAQLQNGSPAQKAKVISNLIQEYGVSIDTLDEVLTGADIPDDESQRFARLLDERLKPITQTLSQFDQSQRAAQTQAQQAQARQIEEFSAKHEFFEDVREDMADLAEMAERRGKTPSLEELYTQACQLNPEVSRVLAQRKASQDNTLAQDEVARKAKAAASISGAPTGGNAGAEPKDLRSALRAAFGGD